jgi:transposase-like protein
MKLLLNVAHFANEETAIAYVEGRLWPNGPICPHCGVIGEASRSKGKTTRLGLWNCRACRKPFSVKIGTVFESSHVPLHIWLQTIYLFCSSKKGYATRQLQRTLGCSMKTAWFLGHRVREAMRDLGIDSTGTLGGDNQVVEADETYVGGKAANRKGKIPPKAIMLSLVERDGRVRSFPVPNVTAQTLKPIIVTNVHKATFLMTDESPASGASSPGTAPSTTRSRSTFARNSGTPTPPRTISRSSSVACMAATSTFRKPICIATLPSSISDTITASGLVMTIWRARMSRSVA